MRVRSRKIRKGLERGDVAEAFESGSIVVVNKFKKEGIALGMGSEVSMGNTSLGLTGNGLDDAAIEALDETVGLRTEWSDEAVDDFAFGADAIERVTTRGAIEGFVFHSNGEAIRELAPIVRDDGVYRMGKVFEEACEEARGGTRIAAGVDFEEDVAGSAIDGDECVALSLLQRRQVFDVDMDEADGGGFEAANGRPLQLGPLIETMPFKRAMNGASGELWIDATGHHLGDVIESQADFGAQLANQGFFDRRKADLKMLGNMRAIADRGTASPASYSGLADAELGG